MGWLKRYFIILRPILLILASSQVAHAVSTQTIPKGIRSPTIRIGYINGLDERFSEDGTMYSNGDLRSVRVNADLIKNVSPQANQLINSLNAMGTMNLGSKIDLGTLRVTTIPEIKYFALGFGYGVNDQWTVGAGIPMVRYQNDLSLSSTRGNKDFYKRQFPGLSSQLDAVWELDLVKETHKTLAAKGYKPLGSRDESFWGDTLITSMYAFKDKPWGGSLLHQLTLTLPTGPQADDSDLMALRQFGKTEITNSLAYSKPVFRNRITAGAAATYNQPIPDKAHERVPLDEEDTLPDASQSREVNRWLGPTLSGLVDLTWKATQSLSLLAGYEYSTKGKDTYSGDDNLKYELLEKQTESTAHKMLLALEADTIGMYRRQSFAVPLIARLSFSNVVAGTNIERIMQTEASLILFF